MEQVAYQENGTNRMVTTRQYDYLNRLTSIANTGTLLTTPMTYTYGYNAANQRTAVTNADNAYWAYQYDALGQVTSGKRYWADGTPVAGQQYGYGFDTIGNRTQAVTGGDASGGSLRTANYTNNSLNQLTSRGVPGYVDVKGISIATNTVTVAGQTAYRKGEYFRQEVGVNNASVPIWTNLTVTATGQTSVSGNAYVPKTSEVFQYDADGNLTNDGHWAYMWDGENRLTKMVANTTVGPQQSLKFEYDWRGRRIHKQVYGNTNWSGTPTFERKYLYDGWNMILAVSSADAWQEGYIWGLDLSGTPQGAGGVGGLLKIQKGSGQYFVGYDGNGNVAELVMGQTGQSVAQYEYGPFGEVLRATGPMAKANPFRFSTKYQDDETDLIMYPYRPYSASTGRWLSRDPIGEPGGVNLYCMVGNNPLTRFDSLGLTDWGDVIPGWWDASWDTLDWVLGHSGSTDYGPDSLQSRQMSQSSIAGQLRQYFLNKNKDKLCKDWKGVSNFKTRFRVFHEVIVDGFNGTAEFVGDARGDVVAKKDLVNCKIKAEFHFMNTTSLRSLLYGLWPDSWNVTLPGFPFANWTQFYTWNEIFDCNCCHSTGVGGSW